MDIKSLQKEIENSRNFIIRYEKHLALSKDLRKYLNKYIKNICVDNDIGVWLIKEN